jgi:glucose/arabinose dehydrogenase
MRIAILSATLLMAHAAWAGELRAGAAAFGDWREDSPGVTRRILPSDLPRPYATANGAEGPSIVARPPGAMPKAPQGFTVSLFASGLEEPRVLRTAPDGGVFLAESGGGRVIRFIPDGKRTIFAEGLHRPFGIAFWPPAAPRFVYVAEPTRVLRYAWAPGQIVAPGEPSTIIDGIPTGGHWTRDLALAPDGTRLFISVGSGSNAGQDIGGRPPEGLRAWQAAHGLGAAYDQEAGRAAVLWFQPDGSGGLHPYAQGLRNCSGLAVQPGAGKLWCVTNERDGLGDNLPTDYATSVTEGAFYGWPWYFIGAHAEPRLSDGRPDLAGSVTVPDVLLQAHSAPLGIAFYTGTAFPAAYRGDAFVALHGSWNRAKRTGYKLVRLHMENGKPDGAYEDFLTGFVASEDGVWGRPVGVTVAPDGALLVSEDANGNIWRIAPARP